MGIAMALLLVDLAPPEPPEPLPPEAAEELAPGIEGTEDGVGMPLVKGTELTDDAPAKAGTVVEGFVTAVVFAALRTLISCVSTKTYLGRRLNNGEGGRTRQ